MNEWYIAFSSGPNGSGETGIKQALEQGKSQQSLKLFMYDLNTLSFVNGGSPVASSLSQSYGGDLTVVDWDKDYQDDAVYLGAVDTSGPSLEGRLLRLNLTDGIASASLGTVLNVGKPVVAAPMYLRDGLDSWLYFGTGRLLTVDDNQENSQQYFIGLKEPRGDDNQLTFTSVPLSDLVDTSAIEVSTTGNLRENTSQGYRPYPVGGTNVNSFQGLRMAMTGQAGWKYRLRYDGSSPSGRNINSATHLFSLVLFSQFQPSDDACQVNGSQLFAWSSLSNRYSNAYPGPSEKGA